MFITKASKNEMLIFVSALEKTFVIFTELRVRSKSRKTKEDVKI